MKKFAGLMLMLLPLVLLDQQCAQAGPLGIAGEYNVFVFGNIEQWGTDIEGRVAAGGNATYGRPNVVDGNGVIIENNGFAIASKITNPSLNLVAGQNVNLTNGSVGYLEPGNTGSVISQKGNIVYGGSAIIAPSVGYGSLQNGNPVDFANAQSYLTALSGNLGGLNPNGTASILKDATNTTYEIDLNGTNSNRNVFSLQASDITQNIAFKFFAPETSTILVNIAGGTASLMNLGFYFNGIAGESEDPVTLQPLHPAGYPYSNILFNFLNATDIDIDQIAIDGSILAPWAHVDFGKNSHIDGNLIASSLLGQGEAHNLPFTGNIPEPATTLLLLAGGLVLMVAQRRRK